MSDRLTHRFGPIERRGILGPVRLGQALIVAFGALSALVVIDRSPTAAGAVIATSVCGAAAAAAVLPLAGRTLDEWAPAVAAFGCRGARRRRRHRSAVPELGFRVPFGRGDRGAVELPCPEPPRTLRGLRIAGVEYRGSPVGVLRAAGGRRLIAVLACRAPAFALLDTGPQERRLVRWGQVLAGAAAAPISRLQWIERTAPAQGDELARWVHTERDPRIPPRGTAMIDSYLELIGASSRVAHEHEVLLAVQLDARQVRERGEEASHRALMEQTEQIARGLEAAEVTVLGALAPAQLVRVFRTAFDPYARTELAARDASDRHAAQPRQDWPPETSAWPLGAEEAWDHYRSDGALHATFWIGAWPRVEVSAMFMDALLGRSSCVRTVAVTFEPVASDRSTREAEAAVTRDHADRELRRRFGQSQTARQRQAEEAALRREAELASGHSEVRFAGFITVSGRDEEELRRACSEVAGQAARARLELHRMYGQQAAAFTFTLPLCGGLR